MEHLLNNGKAINKNNKIYLINNYNKIIKHNNNNNPNNN